jgi:chromate transporter
MTQRAVCLKEAARFWLRLGLVSFGGPAGQLSLLHRELVEERRWLSEQRYLHALNYCMLLPGPEATQLATYLGWLMHGNRGGLIAGGLFLLPSVLVLLTLSSVYALWGELPLLSSIFWALKPAVIAIVLQACWRLGRRTLHTPFLTAIAVAAFLGLEFTALPYPLLIAAAALAGGLAGRLRPSLLSCRTPPPDGQDAGSSATTAAAPLGLEIIHNDTTPTPDHGKPSRKRFAATLLTFGLALVLPLQLLVQLQGWNGMLATMARFFTRVALVSFGGAYAVLPYVARGAVESFGWLSAGQIIDGLALGETTPGPLIMVVAFVGFMGGWNGSGTLVMAVAAALVVVWFTFLPSFAFILVGAPLVESTRENRRLRDPLTGITAAVVGVIASLAVFFALPTLWPETAGARSLDQPALAILLLSMALLLRWRWNVLQLIGAAALVGVLRLLVS